MDATNRVSAFSALTVSATFNGLNPLAIAFGAFGVFRILVSYTTYSVNDLFARVIEFYESTFHEPPVLFIEYILQKFELNWNIDHETAALIKLIIDFTLIILLFLSVEFRARRVFQKLATKEMLLDKEREGFFETEIERVRSEKPIRTFFRDQGLLISFIFFPISFENYFFLGIYALFVTFLIYSHIDDCIATNQFRTERDKHKSHVKLKSITYFTQLISMSAFVLSFFIFSAL